MEPTLEEVAVRIRLGNQQVGYKHRCPNCNSRNTEFFRNQYWLCHNCVVWFQTEDALGYYNTEEYEQDERLPEEWYYE